MIRTLTETIYEGEAFAEHGLYSKTATAYMFGHCVASGFGSGFGIGTGFVKEINTGGGDSFLERIRADREKGTLGQHLNIELFPNPPTPNSEGKILPLTNEHIPFGWKK